MSEHQETRDLLGPFVMGELDPAEGRTVAEHLEDCVSCRREAESMRLVHERMLEYAAVVESPPPHLKDRSVAGLPRQAARRVLPSWMAVAAAALLVALGVAFGPALLGSREVAAANLEPMGESPEAGGEVDIRGAGENLEVRLEVWGLPTCEREEYYELWFVEENGEHVSAGSFTVGESGDVDVDLNAPDFAHSYQRIGITVEKDKDPRPSGVVMLGGELRKS